MKLWLIFIFFTTAWCKSKTERVQLQNIIVQNTVVPSNKMTTTTSVPITSPLTTTITTSITSTTVGTTTCCPFTLPTTATTTLPPMPQIDCNDVEYVLFQTKNISYICSGSVIQNDTSTVLVITVTTEKSTGTTTFPSDHYGRFDVYISKNRTLSARFKINTGNANKVLTGSTNSTPLLPQNNTFNVTATGSYMYILAESNSNTQAVVVAVLEGLILLAILVVMFYKECYAKKKRGPPASFSNPAGTASYTANPYGSSGAGVNYGTDNGATSYYDGAAETYRRDHEGNGTTMRNTAYGYDQPSSIRLEDRSRPSAVDRNSASTQNRVQTETPALVPVPLGADPLNEWGDQRGRGRNDLFS